MLTVAEEELHAAGITDTLGIVLADAGYWKTARSKRSPGKVSNHSWRLTPTVARSPGRDVGAGPMTSCAACSLPNMARRSTASASDRRARVRSDQGQPVADRFLRRGRSAVRSEWRLLAATHNLLKLHRHNLASA
jgi:hypothetical protein